MPESNYSENALKVLEKRYLAKDSSGKPIESPEDLFRRVARNIAGADIPYGGEVRASATAEKFYRAMSSLEFLPNSPTLMNAGRQLQQLSACFVLPVEDSIESIFDAVKNVALIHKSGGGTGFSFSRLRPKNDRVATTGGLASGPLSFMRVFNVATDVIKQGGTRRGANMAILSVEHPDILQFITAKKDPEAYTNFNFSVAVTEDFIQAVKENREYDLRNPRTGEPVRQLNAAEVFDLIVEMSWESGEPGIIFIDRMNSDNPVPHIGRIESTNPCGELPLLPYESCNLGSINLSKMLKKVGDRHEIDYSRLEDTVNLSVHFLDNVIDMNRYPLPEIRKMTIENRKIGLGIMGFADMLIRLGIPYNSNEALKTAGDLMSFILKKAQDASEELARTRGSFPNFKGSTYDLSGAKPIRNATLTTIAPTGTLSIIADCSSGIEPIFAVCYYRRILDDERLVEIHPIFMEIASGEGFYSAQLIDDIARRGTVQGMKRVPSEVRRLFLTAHDIAPEWHIRMQSVFQKYTHNAVSKTINFPEQATQEDIRKAFMLAHEEGCKGITVYRYGSRGRQVLNIGKVEEGHASGPRPRPAVTFGTTEKVATGCGNLYITVNRDELNICEVFTQTGKSGGCDSQSEATSRLISLALRSGLDPRGLVKQLKGIRCPSCIRREGVNVLSCPDALAKAIEKTLNGEKNADNAGAKHTSPLHPSQNGPFCPECGEPLEIAEGCVVCRHCGYSRCA